MRGSSPRMTAKWIKSTGIRCSITIMNSLGHKLMELNAWLVLAAAVFGLTTIIAVPRYVIREPLSSKYLDVVRVATDRNLVRATTAQVVAGLAFVATFIQSANNFSRDYTQRVEQGAAEQFSKAVSQIRENPDAIWSTIGGFHILATIAKSIPSYSEPVYRYFGQFILEVGRTQCEAGNKYRSRDYRPAAALATAMRLLGERRPGNDEAWRKINIAGACMVRGDFFQSGGLSNLYMAAANLSRADVRQSDISDADWGRLRATAEDAEGWNEMSGWTLVSNEERFNLITNFESSHFKRVIFEGAQLKGANFKDATFTSMSFIGADLSKTDLRGAKFKDVDLRWTNMTDANIAGAEFDSSTKVDIDELMTTCVRTEQDKTEKQIDQMKPTISAALERQVQEKGGYRLCK